ncbi:prophage protein [Candidatus Magnetobacterium bavaricum]|uniref:Prophage protein n=1 Tax=Candidatus Magnetobacterium bavaricum TaxID=29290 RepID=A0A0F3GTW8_9BACT|nr:prophage protein [Candidatus Magnetobacterium bavaricum]
MQLTNGGHMGDNIGRLDATLPALTAKIRGYNKEDLLEREPITLDSDAYVEYLKSVAETYPFLAIMGLRVLTETTLKRVCEERKIILLRLCFGGHPHRNPDDTEISSPHLHRYREGYADKWAYPYA